jgi:16S rRNA (uracil1498-N3)-methyltransferase
MTRRLWIADESSSTRAAITGEKARHLVKVLRAEAGQRFEISCGGELRLGRILRLSPERVEFELLERLPSRPLPPVSLLLAVFKFDRLEWAIEKATELGVAEIHPVIARRTTEPLARAAARRVERWRRIAREASQQSRRPVEPVIADPVRLPVAIAATRHAPVRFLLSESETGASLHDALAAAPSGSPLMLAIGPEGGWTEDEAGLFQENGWTPVFLGPTILRAETAAIAALSLAALR